MIEIGETVGIFLAVCLLGVAGFALIDCIYKVPQAAENANLICQEQGYDFYEKYSRIGIWSTTPVAIKCQYVSSYQERDININKAIPVVITE